MALNLTVSAPLYEPGSQRRGFVGPVQRETPGLLRSIGQEN